MGINPLELPRAGADHDGDAEDKIIKRSNRRFR